MSKIQVPFVRSPWNHDLVDNSNLDTVSDFGPSLTQQSQKDDADINVILRRFGVTGTIPITSDRALSFGDFGGVFDFQTAMNAVVHAQREFMLLPADLRTRFANDPQKFVEFCSDGSNEDEMERLGLLSPERVKARLDLAERKAQDDLAVAVAAKLAEKDNGKAS